MTVISSRFKMEIQMHLINNYSSNVNEDAPLILGIDGPPGVGKTFQCKKVLDELKCNVVSLSASDFGSMYECNASNFIVDKYREVAIKRLPVLFLNDIDTAIGEWGKLTQYTSNRQFVLNELMHLCDYPECPHDIPSKRVPIIMTGNDFNKLYFPLIRFGRMKHFEWVPTYDEKKEVIYSILYPMSSRLCEVIYDEAEQSYKELIEKSSIKKSEELSSVIEDSQLEKNIVNDSLPIAFYSQLKVAIDNKYLEIQLEKKGWFYTYNKIQSLDSKLYEKIISKKVFSESKLLDITKSLVETYYIKSYV